MSISHLGEKDEYRGGTELLGMRALDVVPVTEDACAPIAPNSEVCAAESLSDRGAADDCGAECDVRLGNDTSALPTCPAVVASPCADRVHEWPERRCARSFFKPTARACTLTEHSMCCCLRNRGHCGFSAEQAVLCDRRSMPNCTASSRLCCGRQDSTANRWGTIVVTHSVGGRQHEWPVQARRIESERLQKMHATIFDANIGLFRATMDAQ